MRTQLPLFVAADRITVPQDAPALREDHVERLAASMRHHGQLAPVVLTADGTLVAGAHRYEARRRAGEPVLALFLVEDASSATADVIRAEENLARIQQLGPIDRVFGTLAHEAWLIERGERARRGHSGGVTTAQIGESVGVTEGTVRRHLRIGKGLEREVVPALFARPERHTWTMAQLERVSQLDPVRQQGLARELGTAPLRDLLDTIDPIEVPGVPRWEAAAKLFDSLAAQVEASAWLDDGAEWEDLRGRLEALIAEGAARAEAERADAERAEAEAAPEPAPEPESTEPAAPEPADPAEVSPPEPAPEHSPPDLAVALVDALDHLAEARAAAPPPPDATRTWSGPSAALAHALGPPLGLDVQNRPGGARARGPADALEALDRLLRRAPPDPPPSLRDDLRRAVDRWRASAPPDGRGARG
ncbi:MAG: ParB-like chromosome segregation protein Spo0J [Myxococcota bacterium]|jgi:ParB-like chromosome segregation protein Spo0J